MATMIPSRVDEDVPSSAEKRIFNLLERDPDTVDWVVLHSLGLARRGTQPFGEIDFVILVPDEGVICLEVKGGRVSCDSGVWKTMDRFNVVSEMKKSPFMQARESMFALKDAIEDHFGPNTPEARSPKGCAVVFPDVDCPPLTPEFERTDVIDRDDLRRPISQAIKRLAQHRLRQHQPRGGRRMPDRSQVASIRGFLRPDFDRVVTRATMVGRTDSTLLSLTQEQYDFLDNLELNERCLFEGAAGTGKTLLALEHARRSASAGTRVLLVCFNRLLGDWIRRETSDTNVVAGTWHSIARRLIVDSTVGSEFLTMEEAAYQSGRSSEFFEHEFPFYAEIAVEEYGQQFDTLVVDEAQDLISQETLDLLNGTLIGGLAGGRWAIFGDFTRQALYNNPVDPVSTLWSYSQHFARMKLSQNCRNTRRIALETSNVSGFERLPFRLGQEEGPPVEHRYWGTTSGLMNSLQDTVHRLIRDGIHPENIVLLSPNRLENSVLYGAETLAGTPVVDCSRNLDVQPGSIRFSTIHSFKGMESQVVVIIGIEGVDGDDIQSLLYVGMSRARSLLILMIHQSARSSIERRIMAAIAQELQNG